MANAAISTKRLQSSCNASLIGRKLRQHGIGVCAGLAHYLDVPVKLVRVVTVLSIFFGLAFITLVAYIILSFVLDPMPDSAMSDENAPTSSELLDAVDAQLSAGEQRLREMEPPARHRRLRRVSRTWP